MTDLTRRQQLENDCWIYLDSLPYQLWGKFHLGEGLEDEGKKRAAVWLADQIEAVNKVSVERIKKKVLGWEIPQEIRDYIAQRESPGADSEKE